MTRLPAFLSRALAAALALSLAAPAAGGIETQIRVCELDARQHDVAPGGARWQAYLARCLNDPGLFAALLEDLARENSNPSKKAEKIAPDRGN